jgi:hypothetical protein
MGQSPLGTFGFLPEKENLLTIFSIAPNLVQDGFSRGTNFLWRLQVRQARHFSFCLELKMGKDLGDNLVWQYE